MSKRAALITGGSSGIGFAIAEALGGLGYGVTVSARRPEKLQKAAATLREREIDVLAQPANMVSEEEIVALFAAHRERFGRLDVLVNNAGVGIGGAVEGYETKKLDMQLDVNLRGVFLATREALPLLKEAGAEHGHAQVINIASIAGKFGQGWLSVYSATKAGVVGLTQALHKELGESGVKATAICPGFVDTAMTDWIKESVPAEQMIATADLAETVHYLLQLSPACVVPEIMMLRPGESI